MFYPLVLTLTLQQHMDQFTSQLNGISKIEIDQSCAILSKRSLKSFPKCEIKATTSSYNPLIIKQQLSECQSNSIFNRIYTHLRQFGHTLAYNLAAMCAILFSISGVVFGILGALLTKYINHTVGVFVFSIAMLFPVVNVMICEGIHSGNQVLHKNYAPLIIVRIIGPSLDVLDDINQTQMRKEKALQELQRIQEKEKRLERKKLREKMEKVAALEVEE
eukprot:NODE_262_length_11424_cov_0.885828.p8 type:complete len:219 gc:universal NODE_262_length_11424_cov_0.885828:7425-6769(-)